MKKDESPSSFVPVRPGSLFLVRGYMLPFYQKDRSILSYRLPPSRYGKYACMYCGATLEPGTHA